MKEERIEGYLASDDIGYNAGGVTAPVTVTISEVIARGTEKTADGKVIDKAILRFEKAHKGMILNRVNERIVSLLHGRKRAEWTGKPVTLTVRFVDAFGQMDCPVLRVMPPDGLPLPVGVRKWYGREKPGQGRK